MVSITLPVSWPYATLGIRILRNPHSVSYLDTPLLFIFDKLKVFPEKEVDVFLWDVDNSYNNHKEMKFSEIKVGQ